MNDKMRADFEAWAIRECWLAEYALARKKSGVYRDSRAAFAWEAWQASRTALGKEIADNMAASNPVAQRLAVRAGAPWVKP